MVLGSRLKAGSAPQEGMPWWKYVANRFLTGLENREFGLRISEYHTGYRAFRREVLETVNFGAKSDGFVFDQKIIAQIVAAGHFRVAEIAVPARYFPEASSASFVASTLYGLRILALLCWYTLHRKGLRRSRRFDSLRARYHRLPEGPRQGSPSPSGPPVGSGEGFTPRRRLTAAGRTAIIAASVYFLIVLCMGGKFVFTSGLPYETAFPWMSETSSVLGGFVYPADPLRPNTNTFYHAAYLIGEIVSPGSFVPYQIVYAVLWLARGLLVFGILRRLVPHATWLAYTVGALTLVHASDGALQWVGQMNQFGFVFWMLLASYVFVVVNDGQRHRLAAIAMLFVAACQYMSLWSYESGLFIMLLVPVAVVLMRWPLQRFGAMLCAAWYVVPTVYMAATVASYFPRSSGLSYQEGVLRSDWSAVSLVNDLGFNVAASLSFWDWCRSAPVAVPSSVTAFLAFLAVAVFVCGGLLIARDAREREPAAAGERVGVAAALMSAGLLWVVVSFPAYLLLNSARGLWRTQLLSGSGAAMVFSGTATLLAIAVARGRAVRAIALVLAAIVVYYGAACAVQRGGLHERIWQAHRRGIVALLRAVPQVTPATIIVMTNVPKEQDPFKHAYWFDIAMRLAYPKTPVSGIYFFADGRAAQGNSLKVTDGRWQWDGKSAAPLVREGGLDQTVVVQYGADGVGVLLDRFPEFLCPEPCPANTYAPRPRIAGTAPSPRVIHRYGPL